jgi:hypothetical protein
MNKRIAFYLFIILQAFGVIQAQQVQPYWVFLSDKDGCGFSLSAPDRFLSESALQRRERQQIPLSYSDLPVSQVYVTRLENMGPKSACSRGGSMRSVLWQMKQLCRPFLLNLSCKA